MPRAAPHILRHVHSKVAGISRRQDVARECFAGERLQLIPEPSNPHDSNAIKVCRADGRELGYINRELAAELASKAGKGYRFAAIVANVTGGPSGKRTVGVNIAVVVASRAVAEQELIEYVSQLRADVMEERSAPGILRRVGCSATVAALLLLLLTPVLLFPQTAFPTVTGLVNQTTGTGLTSPGSLGSLLGANLSTGSGSVPGPPLPTLIGGTAVTINGAPASLLFVSPTRIDLFIPWQLIGSSSATVVVTSSVGSSAPRSVQLAAFSPTITGSIGVCTNGDCGSVVSRAVVPGETIYIPASGLGDVTPRPSGNFYEPPASPSRTIANVRARVGGAFGTVVFSGLTRNSAGAYEVHAVLPSSTPLGRTVVTIEVDGIQSNAAFIDVVSGAPVPAITADGIVNAANYRRGAVSPGAIVSLFGSNLSVASGPATTLPLSKQLMGVSFQLGDWLLPIFYVSPTQANVMIPWEVSGATELPMRVRLNDAENQTRPMVRIAAVSPGVFTVDQSGLGQGAVLISGTAMLAGPTTIRNARPVRRSEFVEVFCAGLGNVTNTPASGAIALSDPLSGTFVTPAVTIGGIQAQVAFSGLAPGFVGLYQVNVEVPAAAPFGSAVPLALTIGGVAANAVTIAVE